METKTRWNLRTRIAKLFLEVYPPDGFGFKNNSKTYKDRSFAPELLNRFVNITLTKNVPNDTNNPTFSIKPIVVWTTFLGLPNQLGHNESGLLEDILSKRRLLLNFVGWPDEKAPLLSTFRKNSMKMMAIVPLTSLYHLVRIGVQTPRNIAKLGTEFLPGVVHNLAKNGIDSLASITDEDSLGLMAVFGEGLLYVVYHLARIIRGLGTALTSPGKSAQYWLQIGHKKNTRTMYNDVLFTVASITLSCMWYSLIIFGSFRMVALNTQELKLYVTSVFASDNFWPYLAIILSGEGVAGLVMGVIGSKLKICLQPSEPQQNIRVAGVKQETSSNLSYIKALALMSDEIHSIALETPRHPLPPTVSFIVPPPPRKVMGEVRESKEGKEVTLVAADVEQVSSTYFI